MIDTHAHLDALDDPDEAVARAREAGVTRILTVGTDVAGCRRALELAVAHEGVYAILGIHPHAANDATTDDVAEVLSLLTHPKAVGSGTRTRCRVASAPAARCSPTTARTSTPERMSPLNTTTSSYSGASALAA